MSAELIDDPKVPQTVEDDLESFYWVLLWICLSYMESNLDTGRRSAILKGTMNPRVYKGTGGCDKKNFLANLGSLRRLTMDNCPVMPMLIKSLHKRLGGRYRLEPADSDLLQPGSSPTSDPMQSETKHASEGVTSSGIQSAEQSTKAVGHEELLQMLQDALKKDSWPEADRAVRQDVIDSQDEKSRFSSSKRSHSEASRNGGFCVPPQAKRPENY